MSVKPLVISLGNRYRGDDGAGPLVLDSLAHMASEAAEFIENPGDIGQLIAAWQDRDAVYIIDAARSDRLPVGEIIELDGLNAELPPGIALVSSHGLNLPEALLLGRMLGNLPRSLRLHAIVGGNYAMGSVPSPAVEASVRLVATGIAEKLQVGHAVPDRSTGHA